MKRAALRPFHALPLLAQKGGQPHNGLQELAWRNAVNVTRDSHMSEHQAEKHAECASESQKPEQGTEGGAAPEAAACRKSVKARREHVFEDTGHIRGYSAELDVSRLALVFFTEE